MNDLMADLLFGHQVQQTSKARAVRSADAADSQVSLFVLRSSFFVLRFQ